MFKTSEEVIAQSKLLSKAYKLGIIYVDIYGHCVFTKSENILLNSNTKRVFVYDLECDGWIKITSIKQVEESFKQLISLY